MIFLQKNSFYCRWCRIKQNSIDLKSNFFVRNTSSMTPEHASFKQAFLPGHFFCCCFVFCDSSSLFLMNDHTSVLLIMFWWYLSQFTILLCHHACNCEFELKMLHSDSLFPTSIFYVTIIMQVPPKWGQLVAQKAIMYCF